MNTHYLTCRTASLAVTAFALVLAFGLGQSLGAATIGYYQFEDTPGVLEDSSTANRDLTQVGTAGGQVASPFGSVPNAPAGSVANSEAMSFALNRAFTATDTAYTDLTIESFVSLTSTDLTQATARVIASQFGAAGNRAFNFGVTGNGSTTFTDHHTLFLQLSKDGTNLLNLDSGFRLTLGVNYYLAVSIDAGSSGADGSATFYLKDLTNGGTLQTSTVAATGLSSIFNTSNVFTIGGSTNGTTSRWDGVIDEVRFSDVALGSSDLLITSTIPEPSTTALLLGGLALCVVALRRRRA